MIGSVARGTATPTSDIDFLVSLDPDRNLLDLGALQVALEELLACAVHVIPDEHGGREEASTASREGRLMQRLRADAVPV